MNILFISDNAREVKLFRSALDKIDSNIRFESCHKLNEALHKINATDVRLDFIFLNYDLLKNNARRVLNSLHSTQNAAAIIVVLLSSITSAELDAIASLGVHYFFDRKIFVERLSTSLKILIETSSIIQSNTITMKLV